MQIIFNYLNRLKHSARRKRKKGAYMIELNEIYTTKEVAEVLHCSTHQVSTLRKFGLITGTRFGKNWLYDKNAIISFISACRGKDLYNLKNLTPEAARKKYLENQQ